MEAKTTVIYYSSNRENPDFEKIIRKKLAEVVSHIPVIMVTQSEDFISFGQHICVGDIGVSEQSLWTQMLIGCLIAKTPFVHFAEADTVYPPGYFQQIPDEVNQRYWYEPVYIFYHNKEGFYAKGRSDVAHIAGREYIIRLLSEGLNNKYDLVYEGSPRPTPIYASTPVVSIKTGHGMRPKTQTALTPTMSLPYWGTWDHFKREMNL